MAEYESGMDHPGCAWLRFRCTDDAPGFRVQIERREGWLRFQIARPPADVVFSPSEIPVLLAWLKEQFPDGKDSPLSELPGEKRPARCVDP